jgi:hypothetical protein
MAAMRGSAGADIDAPVEAVWAIVRFAYALEEKLRQVLTEGRRGELNARVETG